MSRLFDLLVFFSCCSTCCRAQVTGQLDACSSNSCRLEIWAIYLQQISTIMHFVNLQVESYSTKASLLTESHGQQRLLPACLQVLAATVCSSTWLQTSHQRRRSRGTAAKAVCSGASPSSAAGGAAMAAAQAVIGSSMEVVTRKTVEIGCVAVTTGADLTAWAVSEASAAAVASASCACAKVDAQSTAQDIDRSFQNAVAESECGTMPACASMLSSLLCRHACPSYICKIPLVWIFFLACSERAVCRLQPHPPTKTPFKLTLCVPLSLLAADTQVACVGADGQPVAAEARVTVTAAVSVHQKHNNSIESVMRVGWLDPRRIASAANVDGLGVAWHCCRCCGASALLCRP